MLDVGFWMLVEINSAGAERLPSTNIQHLTSNIRLFILAAAYASGLRR
jgi:hypothetical protein